MSSLAGLTAMPLPLVALIAATFLIAGFVKGVVGVGFPTISVGVLTATVGLEPALALVVVPAVATNIWQALAGPHLRELTRRFALFLIAATVFTWAGVAIVVKSGHPLLPLVLAASLVMQSVLALSGVRLPVPAARETLLSPILGAATGVMMGLTGSATVPAVYYFDTLGLDRDRMVQAMGILFLLITVALGLSLAERAAFDGHIFVLSLAGLAPTVAGLYAGRRVRGRLSETTFRQALYVSLIALAAVIVWRTLA